MNDLFVNIISSDGEIPVEERIGSWKQQEYLQDHESYDCAWFMFVIFFLFDPLQKW